MPTWRCRKTGHSVQRRSESVLTRQLRSGRFGCPHCFLCLKTFKRERQGQRQGNSAMRRKAAPRLSNLPCYHCPEFRPAGGAVVCEDAPRLRRLRVSRRAQRGSRAAKRRGTRLPLMRASTAAFAQRRKLCGPYTGRAHLTVGCGTLQTPCAHGATRCVIVRRRSPSFVMRDHPASTWIIPIHARSNCRKLIFTRKQRTLLTCAHIAEFCIMPVDNVMRH